MPGIRRLHGEPEKGLNHQYLLGFIRAAIVQGLYLLSGKSRGKESFAKPGAGVGNIRRSRECDSTRILSEPDDAREIPYRGAHRSDFDSYSHEAIRRSC